MGIIEALEGSGFATWVRESPSLLAYTGILSMHGMGLAIVVGLNVVVALSLLGVGPRLPVGPARKFFPYMYAGFALNALSGLMLFSAYASNMLTSGVFLVKMGFIVLAMGNLQLLKRYAFGHTASMEAAVGPPAVSSAVRLLAANSLVLWTAAIVTGRLTAYPGLVRYYLFG